MTCSKSEGMNSSEECMMHRFLLLLCNHLQSWQVYDALRFKICSYFKKWCSVLKALKYTQSLHGCVLIKNVGYLFVQKSVCDE